MHPKIHRPPFTPKAVRLHAKDRLVVLFLFGAWAVSCTYVFAYNLQGWGY